MLPLSHDEVVHGKGSLLDKMPGDRWQKFANLRAYYGFMFGHPGKKLLFMGSEFAQEREWNHDRSLDWHLLGDPLHAGVQRLVRDLNHLHPRLPALHQRDFDGRRLRVDRRTATPAHRVLSFVRRGRGATTLMLVVCNFTPVVRHGYRVGVPRAGRWRERLNTDSAHYGGSNVGTPFGEITAEPHGLARPAAFDRPDPAAAGHGVARMEGLTEHAAFPRASGVLLHPTLAAGAARLGRLRARPRTTSSIGSSAPVSRCGRSCRWAASARAIRRT